MTGVQTRALPICRKGISDVAGGTHALADDEFIGIARPQLGFPLRKSIGSVLEARLSEIRVSGGVAEDSREGVTGCEDFVAAMSERDVSRTAARTAFGSGARNARRMPTCARPPM